MILAVIQARTSSTRLPNKVLMPILGVPMLARQIERASRATMLDKLVVATSVDPADDAVEAVAAEAGVECTRGALDDVLDRVHDAAVRYAPDHVVRLTGDCPLADPEIIDGVVRMHIEGDYDYTSSALTPTFPDGLDAEAIRMSALERAWSEAVRIPHREHVTLWLYDEPRGLRVASYVGGEDLSSMRWTVDEPADLEFVRAVFEELYPTNPTFGYRDVLALLEERPEIACLNRGFARNEGLSKSLRDEAESLDDGSGHV